MNKQFQIIKYSDGVVRQVAPNKTVTNLISKEISDNVSLATTKATDYAEAETTAYDRIYFVIDGELEFTYDGKTHVLGKGDACFIPRGSTYEMRGSFEVVTVNHPAFGTVQ
jgi:ethanolamine utilization protein EutQ (cupin superfamily)